MLWKSLKEDDFETDIVEVLKEYALKTGKTNGIENFVSRDFSEIYMFFDYDRHVNNAGCEDLNDAIILEMLETFNDETNLGKLYINYPMVESIRDIKRDDQCFRRCCIPIDESGVYKHTVSDMREYQDCRKYTVKSWEVLLETAKKKANCIVNDSYSEISRREYLHSINQKVLFDKHLDKYVANGKIAILSSIPLFLFEYFKEEYLSEIIKEI